MPVYISIHRERPNRWSPVCTLYETVVTHKAKKDSFDSFCLRLKPSCPFALSSLREHSWVYGFTLAYFLVCCFFSPTTACPIDCLPSNSERRPVLDSSHVKPNSQVICRRPYWPILALSLNTSQQSCPLQSKMIRSPKPQFGLIK